jgi:hypothetical protein
MAFFRKKNKNTTKSVTSQSQIDLEPSLEAYTRGLISLATDYFLALEPAERHRLINIYTIVTGDSQEGKSIPDATTGLTLEQLKKLQQLIEADYKFTRH